MEYKFPDEPPIGSKVEDKNGKIWKRISTFSFENWASSVHTSKSWQDLIAAWGPLKDYVEPQNGDVRRIRDKSSPAYFEVFINGSWHQYFKGTGRDVVKYEEPVDW